MDVSTKSPIQPEFLYSLSQIASIFEVDVRWVKENLIFNRTCRYKKRGNIYMVLGMWLIEWANEDHNHLGDSEPNA